MTKVTDIFLGASRRFLSKTLPTMLGIVLLGFGLLHLMPGDAADALAGMAGSASAESMEQIRNAYGLNDSLFMQLVNYLTGLARLDFGTSILYGKPVFDLILERLPATLTLMLTAFALALSSGILLGWVMAVFAGRWPDRVLTASSSFFYSAPNFWVGLMFIVVFAAKLRWLPQGGAESIGMNLSGMAWFMDRVQHVILPASSLAVFFVAIYARLTRAALIEVLRQDYIRTAMAKGLHPIALQLRHGLRNALIPVITVAGVHLGNMLSGAIVVETVFNWPGIGRLTMDALAGRDNMIILGILLISSVIVIATNMLVDWIVSVLDPRVEA